MTSRSLISVFGSLVGQEELREVEDCFTRQWLGIGPKTHAFEVEFAKRRRLPGLALVDSGSNALFLVMKLLDLPPGAEVIVPSFTWIACAHAVVLAGGVPVFCDVDLDTQNITAETIAPHVTPQTRAIMVVHYAGKPVVMDPILALGLPVIEDAAHAVDSDSRGRPCGGIGLIGVFSFDSVKNLTMGEGGGITSTDPSLIERARNLRYCGIGKSGLEASVDKTRWWEYNIADFLPKMLPNDVAASIGLAQLRKLDALQRRRREIWDTYQREIGEMAWLVCPKDAAPDERHSYFTYCVRVLGGRRDALAKHLYDEGIYTTLRYHPLHMNAIYGSKSQLPNVERLNEEALSLPIHPRLTHNEVDKILSAIRAFRV